MQVECPGKPAWIGACRYPGKWPDTANRSVRTARHAPPRLSPHRACRAADCMCICYVHGVRADTQCSR